MYAGYKSKSFAEVPELTVEQVRKCQAGYTVLFVDRRKPKEQKISMLPGAMTEKDFEARLDEIQDNRSITLVIYCTIGDRSGKYTQKLRNRGLQAFNLVGGILMWVLKGGKVYDPAGETNRVHVYGRRWNLLPPGYEAVF